MRRRSVAQLAEHRSPKPGAGGSRPSTPAIPPVGSGQQKAKIGPMRKIIEFGREVEREVRKVSWPSGKEVWQTTLVIFVMAAVASVFFFLVDWGISKLIRYVLNIHG